MIKSIIFEVYAKHLRSYGKIVRRWRLQDFQQAKSVATSPVTWEESNLSMWLVTGYNSQEGLMRQLHNSAPTYITRVSTNQTK